MQTHTYHMKEGQPVQTKKDDEWLCEEEQPKVMVEGNMTILLDTQVRNCQKGKSDLYKETMWGG